VECDDLFVMNFIISVLSKFKTKLLAANHLIIRDRTKFVTEQKSSKFLLEIMTLVSLVYTGSDTELILRGRSFIYVMNSTDPRIYPWGIPRFIVPHSEKKCSVE